MKLITATFIANCITFVMTFLGDRLGYFWMVSVVVITILVYNKLSDKEENEQLKKDLNEIKIALDEIRKDRG
ncbi:MAG: hypothetical protein ACRDDY_12505 [Clostridium sp.]|uniref:hypothetical protein n=1 Tax=Clostridium sp. TaxID=1506 RepID=UPI003EE498EE